jgi:hypothetical protein
MTVDVRAVNSQTEATQWSMPLLEVVLNHMQRATVFFSLDFFKGYWQLPLHPSCQEMFSFLTDLGDYTPTRVLIAGTDGGERLGGILPGGGPRDFPRPAVPRDAGAVGRLASVCGRRREVIEPVGSSARDMQKNGVET